jgi:hypothetical protein
MRRKLSRWYWFFPGGVYALGPCGPFANERESRADARAWAGVTRLPRGFQTWKES